MSIHYVKIKITSLAAEMALIRKEEHRIKGYRAYCMRTANADFERIDAVFWGLRSHRRLDLRPEVRAAQVAYGYLKGKRYHQIEKPLKGNEPNWHRVTKLVMKYGPQSDLAFDTVYEATKKTLLEWAS